MAMNINPSNLSSAKEVKNYSIFKQIKGHVDTASANMKNIDNDDKVDLSPAMGNVAVENRKVFGGNVLATGSLTYDVQTGNVQKLDLDTSSSASYMGTSDTIKGHISFSDEGNTSVYDFKKSDHVHDHLSELTDNSFMHIKCTVNKETGVINYEDLS